MFRTIKQPKICFIHIPKCGGTSLNNAIRRSLGISRFSSRYYKVKSANTLQESVATNVPLRTVRQKVLSEKLGSSKLCFITGHVPCTTEIMDSHKNEWEFITLLRDPVERWYSHYFFNYYKRSKHTKTNLPIDQYINSETGRENGRIYLSYFGEPNVDDVLINRDVDSACEKLKQFSVVGILEALPEFENQLKSSLGVNLSVGFSNRNSKKKPSEFISEEVHQRVVEICRDDIFIYNNLKNRLFSKD